MSIYLHGNRPAHCVSTLSIVKVGRYGRVLTGTYLGVTFSIVFLVDYHKMIDHKDDSIHKEELSQEN